MILKSIFDEILKIRGEKSTDLKHLDGNRYCMVIDENNGSHTAYCCSVPVRNKKTLKFIDLHFGKLETSYCLYGTHSKITIENDIILENEYGACTISLPDILEQKGEISCKGRDFEVFPTLNGLAFKVSNMCDIAKTIKLSLTSVYRPFEVFSNKRCFSLKMNDGTPFLTLSCIGSLDEDNSVIGACEVMYKAVDNNQYVVTILPKNKEAKYTFYEINFHEFKLFQDTTVDSFLPDANNAFGGTAFIGNSETYGEQWLYSKPDFSLVPELLLHKINRAILHIPKLNNKSIGICVFPLQKRFCSVGTTWNNKIAYISEKEKLSSNKNEYLDIDITEFVVNKNNDYLIRTDGFVIKSCIDNNDYIVISTGDSYYAPQILELNYDS